MFRMLQNLLEKAITVASAFTFSQAPLYMKQYALILQGHVAELQQSVKALNSLSQASSMTLVDYIEYFRLNSDSIMASQGDFIASLLQRCDKYSHDLAAWQSAAEWKRPFIFLKNIQFELMQETGRHFTPGLNFTYEDIIYITIGMVLGWSAFRFLCFLLKRAIRVVASDRDSF